jgi:hypothetical protein
MNGEPKSAVETAEEVEKLLINTRVKRIRPLVPPQILQEDYPLYVYHLLLPLPPTAPYQKLISIGMSNFPAR